MDSHFADLFDLSIPEDKKYSDAIPQVKYEVFLSDLKKDLSIINNSEVSVKEWIIFKNDLLETEQRWGVTVFNWAGIRNKKKPYISIDINWDVLENKPTRYFQVHMAFENIWFGPRLTNIWDTIDDSLDSFE